MPKVTARTTEVTSLSLEDRLTLATEMLKRRYEALNEQFTIAESRLRALKPTKPVWIRYNEASNREDGVDSWELIGFFKHDGKWRIVHAEDHSENHEDVVYNPKPVIECPVETRLVASKLIPEIRERIVVDKEEYLAEVEAAISRLTDFCDGK